MNFIERARAEFQRRWHSPIHDHSPESIAIQMATWGNHQEVTQEEILATARFLAKSHFLRNGSNLDGEVSDEDAQGFIYDAEEVLNVALDVRRQSLI